MTANGKPKQQSRQQGASASAWAQSSPPSTGVVRAGRSRGDVWDPPLVVIGDIVAGLLGAIGALVVAAGAAVRAVWLQDRPRRKVKRTFRRLRWRRSRDWRRTLFWAEVTLVGTWLVARSTIWVLVHLPRGISGAGAIAADGWRAGVSSAQGRRPHAQDPQETAGVGGDRAAGRSGAGRPGPAGRPAGESEPELVEAELLCTWTGPGGCTNVVEAGQLLCGEHDPEHAAELDPELDPERDQSSPASDGASAAPSKPAAGGAGQAYCAWVLEGGVICDQPLSDGELFCPHHGQSGPNPAAAQATRGLRPGSREWWAAQRPETEAERRFWELRAAGYKGPINHEGHPVDDHGRRLDLDGNGAVHHDADGDVDVDHGRDPEWWRAVPGSRGVVHDPLAGGDRFRVCADPADPDGPLYAWIPGEGSGPEGWEQRIGGPFRTQAQIDDWIDRTWPYSTRRPRLVPTSSSQTPDAPASGPGAAPASPAATPTPASSTSTGGIALMPTTTTTHGQIAGELRAIGDLEREGAKAWALLDQFEALGRQIKSWSTGLPDRYATAPFGTTNLTKAVNGISEHHRQAGALREQLGVLERACVEALSLGDHVDAVKADGEAEAYIPQ